MAGQRSFAEIESPALLLDLNQVERNIDLYQGRATAAGMALRPHEKAHKCSRVGLLQVKRGAVGLCCAKLAEADAMAAGGLTDLYITTPVIGSSKIQRLVELARKVTMAVVADDAANIAALASAARDGKVRIGVLVEVDVGQGHMGVPPGPAAAALAAQIRKSPGLEFRGLHGYQGAANSVESFSERSAQVNEAMAKLKESMRFLADAGIECRIKSGGGTGTFAIDLELGVLNELQTGSYVTMDTTYSRIKLSSDSDERSVLGHPLTILATVLSRPTADRAVVDVGWKSASCDAGPPSVTGRPGLTYEFAGDEHGIIRHPGGMLSLEVGERVELIPSHCDTTVNLYDRFVVHRDGRPETTWSIEARGKSQ